MHGAGSFRSFSQRKMLYLKRPSATLYFVWEFKEPRGLARAFFPFLANWNEPLGICLNVDFWLLLLVSLISFVSDLKSFYQYVQTAKLVLRVLCRIQRLVLFLVCNAMRKSMGLATCYRKNIVKHRNRFLFNYYSYQLTGKRKPLKNPSKSKKNPSIWPSKIPFHAVESIILLSKSAPTNTERRKWARKGGDLKVKSFAKRRKYQNCWLCVSLSFSLHILILSLFRSIFFSSSARDETRTRAK